MPFTRCVEHFYCCFPQKLSSPQIYKSVDFGNGIRGLTFYLERLEVRPSRDAPRNRAASLSKPRRAPKPRRAVQIFRDAHCGPFCGVDTSAAETLLTRLADASDTEKFCQAFSFVYRFALIFKFKFRRQF